MQMSNTMSWQTRNCMKGNHRRMMVSGKKLSWGLKEHLLLSFLLKGAIDISAYAIAYVLFFIGGKIMKKIGIILALALVLVGCSSTPTVNKEDSFTVGMECNYAPFNWTTLDSNETSVKISDVDYCDGYDVVIATKLANSLDKTLVIKKIAWEGLEPALSSGEIDAIIAGMTETPERAQNADFTSPYYESEMVMIVRKDDALVNSTNIQDFSGKKVLGQINTLYDDIIDQIQGVDHAVPLATYPLMIVSLQSKEVDALTAELPVATGVVNANPDLTIVKFSEGNGFDADTTVSIAVKKGNTELLNKLEETLGSISADERNQLMLDATSRQPAGE